MSQNVTLSSLTFTFQSIPLGDLKTLSQNSNNLTSTDQQHRKSSTNSRTKSTLPSDHQEIDWTRTDIPPPLSGHASCMVMNGDDDSDGILVFMGGISVGFKRVNTVWLFSPSKF